MNLIEKLINGGWLKTPLIIDAFRKIKRADFLPENLKDLAEENEALPIGYEQTISQPLVVAFMLELLEPKRGEKILDVGAGSGWTSALLAEIVGEKGKVAAFEIIKELAEFGKNNVAKYGFVEKGIVDFICADGSEGYGKEAPFDKILCSAAIFPKETEENIEKSIPTVWKNQLKVFGKIVAPVNFSIWKLEKSNEQRFISKEYPGFSFVPLKNGK